MGFHVYPLGISDLVMCDGFLLVLLVFRALWTQGRFLFSGRGVRKMENLVFEVCPE